MPVDVTVFTIPPSPPVEVIAPLWKSIDKSHTHKVWLFRWINRRYFVREEYHDAIVAIIEWFTTRTRGAPMAMAAKLSVTPRTDNVADHDTYPNPFLHATALQAKPVGEAAVIITGLPGIGKSAFLFYVFALRVAMNLPTLLASDKTSYLWVDGQCYEGTLPAPLGRLDDSLPSDAWILVDSGESDTPGTAPSYTATVPERLHGLDRFLLQAASPREFRRSWVNKVSFPVKIFAMKPWSFEELLLSTNIAEINSDPYPGDEKCLYEFYTKYGGSCRDALKFGIERGTLEKFEVALREKANALKREEFDSLIESNMPSTPVGDGISHFLISAFPIDDFDRDVFENRPVTSTVSQIVFEAYSRHHGNKKQETFEALMQLNGGGRSVAAYYYDNHYHYYLYYMRPPKRKRNSDQKTQAWSSTWDASMRAPLTLNLRQSNAEPIPSVDFNFHTESGPLKPRHYYRPTTRTVPMFDSLFVSSRTHALVFQASIALKHDVNYEGLYWLYKIGIRTIEYVYITPSPTLNLDYVRVTIPFPASVPDTLDYPGLNCVVRCTNDAKHTTTEDEEEEEEMNIDADQEIVHPGGKKAIPKIVAIYHAILDVSDTADINKTNLPICSRSYLLPLKLAHLSLKPGVRKNVVPRSQRLEPKHAVKAGVYRSNGRTITYLLH